ncbi:DNA damage-induced apoptosis suppressor protein isoform X4 [Choloepus didactylus]|uniref:DNA damage-induced apoptosis suppressor protein isoform X4 n=1 Tax=Choloepus didactylus TaxID=27675 RepID=UPI0018A07035|nr:DNA damage-induced apoptosis suppressor protein isoform X4 [Choloepus didactylus]
MNRRRKFLLASVLAVQNSSFIYPSCQKCFSRIILVSKRSNCPKCGSSGGAENASYRYKLSLKVAESNKLFHITVFGSCLDTYFGLSATGLHRYIENPNEILETLDSDTTQNLLTKAVETCFIGQNFIFGVTQLLQIFILLMPPTSATVFTAYLTENIEITSCSLYFYLLIVLALLLPNFLF